MKKYKKRQKKKLMYAGFGALVAILLIGFLFYSNYKSKLSTYSATSKEVSGVQTELPTMTEKELAPFNGDDPKKPIYIGFEGKVYDVSTGRDFYKKDGPYHYLAGKDSTSDLELVGGNIIKRKYPVVAHLSKQ